MQGGNYYPFGLAFNSYQRENSLKQNYLYNGKEIQDELDLGWYDYIARQFDPAIGRFMSVDPAADLMRRYSPYAYSFDNPIRFIDPDGMIPEDVTDPEDPKNKKTIAQKVDALYETPQSATKTPNEGGEAGISGTISVGLQGGISVKAFGENLSLFVNFGSIDVVTLGNEGVDMQKLPDTNIKEGIELGLGPVGVSKEIETSIDHSGIETKEKVSANLLNIEASSTSYKEVKNPESFNPQKTEVSNTSLGVTQSAKGGLFVVGSVSAGASYTLGKGPDTQLNPKYVASDATRVAPVVRRFK